MQIRHLDFRYSADKPALFKDFSLDVSEPGIHILMGGSGCGKTTLLRLIGGLEPSTAQSIIHTHPISPSWVFQEPRLVPWLNVRENIQFSLNANKRRSAHYLQHFEELLQVFRIGEIVEQLPHTLSGGQKHRVAMARSLLCGQGFYLWDEPFSGLDNNLRQIILGYLRLTWEKQEALAIISLHDLADANFLGHTITKLSPTISE